MTLLIPNIGIAAFIFFNAYFNEWQSGLIPDTMSKFILDNDRFL